MLKPEQLGELGRVANGWNARTPLTPFEEYLLRVTSLGNTVRQVARRMEVDPKLVHSVREIVPVKLGVPNLAAAVDYGFQNGILLASPQPNSNVNRSLTLLDTIQLGYWARGLGDAAIAAKVGRQIPTITSNGNGLLEKIGAWNRPHAIRRGYRLGLFAVKAAG